MAIETEKTKKHRLWVVYSVTAGGMTFASAASQVFLNAQKINAMDMVRDIIWLLAFIALICLVIVAGLAFVLVLARRQYLAQTGSWLVVCVSSVVLLAAGVGVVAGLLAQVGFLPLMQAETCILTHVLIIIAIYKLLTQRNQRDTH